MALVPYAAGSHGALAALHCPAATFRFAGRPLRIRQRWAQLGVAAVVWDAVALMCQTWPFYPISWVNGVGKKNYEEKRL
uniref:Uncharacterized protein n=1 Tax=Nothoprocta perdicaria TaxID=30464 RepID=A0A8C6ZCW3_NOTPE